MFVAATSLLVTAWTLWIPRCKHGKEHETYNMPWGSVVPLLSERTISKVIEETQRESRTQMALMLLCPSCTFVMFHVTEKLKEVTSYSGRWVLSDVLHLQRMCIHIRHLDAKIIQQDMTNGNHSWADCHILNIWPVLHQLFHKARPCRMMCVAGSIQCDVKTFMSQYTLAINTV